MGQYKFAEQLAIGEAWEQKLDQFFLARFPVRILPASMADQRRGIDRLFVSESGSIDEIEYKADSLAGRTGNAFIETVSVDTTGKPGWAVSSQAKYLVYLVTEPETIYFISMGRIRAKLSRWQTIYKEASAQNNGYKTLGLLVPLDELERIAIQVW
jgi:hypothetical protein